ncbi:guanylin family protein [Corythoichthys intestinalis]|uniref:guanylin family protein n=1 Tax=Corythoichthys intestinalis TaxID=161448 RepID=UPI0025A5E6D8|nr:guanylin family protein [Corythoichthys intestinalis]XP_061813466.1 guanylate cyclase activator 2B-like [Nerophis lumbriciformis]
MKITLACIALLVLVVGHSAEAVQVEENGLSFSLEAVKRLQEMFENVEMPLQNPRLRASLPSMCENPMLPQELLPLCKQKGASASLARLAMVPLDVCEICAFAACSGC